jgi:hypothetical protein
MVYILDIYIHLKYGLSEIINSNVTDGSFSLNSWKRIIHKYVPKKEDLVRAVTAQFQVLTPILPMGD